MLECIEATYAQVITYEDAYIYPEYCYLAAGNTRDMKEAYGREDFSYLKAQISKPDIEAEDYIQVFYYTMEEFRLLCENQWGLEGATYEITATDSGEYVTSITIDDKVLTGEEFRQGLTLPSPAFMIKEIKGHIRIVTKGDGHGFGVSLYGANEMAKMGATYDSILKYYYSGVEIKTE